MTIKFNKNIQFVNLILFRILEKKKYYIKVSHLIVLFILFPFNTFHSFLLYLLSLFIYISLNITI